MQNISVSTSLWIILGLANIPIYMLIGKIFFDSSDDFGDTVMFIIQPDFLSLFRGENFKDVWHSYKFGMFLAVLGAVVTGEHTLISYLLNEYVIEMNDATLYSLIFETT